MRFDACRHAQCFGLSYPLTSVLRAVLPTIFTSRWRAQLESSFNQANKLSQSPSISSIQNRKDQGRIQGSLSRPSLRVAVIVAVPTALQYVCITSFLHEGSHESLETFPFYICVKGSGLFLSIGTTSTMRMLVVMVVVVIYIVNVLLLWCSKWTSGR